MMSVSCIEEIQLVEADGLSRVFAAIPKSVGSLIRQEIVWTKFTVSQKYFIVGTNVGLVYVCDRAKSSILHELCYQDKNDPVSCIKLTNCLDGVIAVGHESGVIAIYQLPAAGSHSKARAFCVKDSHNSPVTCLEWSHDSAKLFSGDRSGVVVCTEITYQQFRCHSFSVCHELHPIVQLNCSDCYLLVSTWMRSFIYNLNHSSDVIQIGQAERKIPGPFGALFVSDANTVGDAVIYASRPGFRIWKANSKGTVDATLSFREQITDNSRCVTIKRDVVLENFRRPTVEDLQFGCVMPYGPSALLISGATGLYVISHVEAVVKCYHCNLGPIVDVSICGDEIYVLRRFQHRPVLKLSPLNKVRETNSLPLSPTLPVSPGNSTEQQSVRSDVTSIPVAAVAIGQKAVKMKNGILSAVKEVSDKVQKLPALVTVTSQSRASNVLAAVSSETESRVATSGSESEIPLFILVNYGNKNVTEMTNGLVTCPSIGGSPDSGCSVTGTITRDSSVNVDLSQVADACTAEIFNSTPRLPDTSCTTDMTSDAVDVVDAVCDDDGEISYDSSNDREPASHFLFPASVELPSESAQINWKEANGNALLSQSDNDASQQQAQSNETQAPRRSLNSNGLRDDDKSEIIYVSSRRRKPAFKQNGMQQVVAEQTVAVPTTGDNARFTTSSKATTGSILVTFSGTVGISLENMEQTVVSGEAIDQEDGEIVEPSLDTPDGDDTPRQNLNIDISLLRNNSPILDFVKNAAVLQSVNEENDTSQSVPEATPSDPAAEITVVCETAAGESLEANAVVRADPLTEDDDFYSAYIAPVAPLSSSRDAELHRDDSCDIRKGGETNRTRTDLGKLRHDVKLPKVGGEFTVDLDSYIITDSVADSCTDGVKQSSLLTDEVVDERQFIDKGLTVTSSQSSSAQTFNLPDRMFNTESRQPGSLGVNSVSCYSLADQWTVLPAPSNIQSLSVSSRHVWCVDFNGCVFYSALNGPKLHWFNVKGVKAKQVSVSPSAWIVWRLDNGSVFAASGVAARRNPCGNRWSEVARDVAYISADDSVAWYLKVDGSVYMQKGLSRYRPCYRAISIQSAVKMKQIVCRNGVVWALAIDGNIVARVGIEPGREEGTDWVFLKGFETGPSSSVSFDISSDGVVWVLNTAGELWFTVDVTAKSPQGKGVWWQAWLNLSGITNAVPNATDAFGTSVPGGLVSAACNGIWLCPQFKDMLHFCQGSVVGHRWHFVSSGSLWSSLKWKSVSPSADCVWLMPSSGTLLCVVLSATSSCRVIEVQPPEIGCFYASISASNDNLWCVLSNGHVYCRMSMRRQLCPQGTDWRYIDMIQLDQCRQKLREISICTQSVWSLSIRGTVYFRLGVKQPAPPLNPAWVADDENTPLAFNHVSASADGKLVWALDCRNHVFVRCGISDDLLFGTHWSPVAGMTAKHISCSNLAVYCIDCSGHLFVRLGISSTNVAGDSWHEIAAGALAVVAAAPTGELWGLNAAGQLYQHHLYKVEQKLSNLIAFNSEQELKFDTPQNNPKDAEWVFV